MRQQLTLFVLFTAPFAALADGSELVDRERNLHIPADADARDSLHVAATFDDDKFRLHYRYETDNPSWYHQYWRYEDGEWVRYGSGSPGPDAHRLYEDRISMMLDDGSVDGFDRYGGWMLIHEGMRTLTSEADEEQVTDHPKLGEEMGRSDVRKYLPQSRDVDDPGDLSWDAIRDDDELAELQDEGVFLDLWQWRAHRSHPMGVADNGYVLHYRLSSQGRSMFTDNWDDEAGHPAYMFDPETTGRRALDWDALVNREYGQDDPYFIDEHNAVPFDPDHDWQEGDVIPQRFLRQPDGSRGAIRAEGGYRDGSWRITLTRSMEAPNRLDSKTLEPGETYNVAFAVHSGAVGARWHRVSLPQTLGLDVDEADVVAVRTDGEPDEDALEWTEILLIYPGQVTWQWLHGDHPGSPMVRDAELGVRDFHDLEQLQQFILDQERRRAAQD